MYFLLKMVIFHCYVSLLEGRLFFFLRQISKDQIGVYRAIPKGYDQVHHVVVPSIWNHVDIYHMYISSVFVGLLQKTAWEVS